jgi:transposase
MIVAVGDCPSGGNDHDDADRGCGLAKEVFEVVDTRQAGPARRRLSRTQFERFLTSLPTGTEVVMEACATAHHWGRRCHALGLVPILLPTPYARPYVRRNKTDRNDAEALVEARRCGGILPVPVRPRSNKPYRVCIASACSGVDAHRSHERGARPVARVRPVDADGRRHAAPRRSGLLAPTAVVALPALLRETLRTLIEEIRDLEDRLKQLDRQLPAIADADPVS